MKFLVLILFFTSCVHKKSFEIGAIMNEWSLEILHEEEGSGRIFAKAKVDGHPINFYVDTGSNRTKVKTNEFYDRYTDLESKEIMGISGKSLKLSKIKVQNISMGPFSVIDHEILRYPNSPEFDSTSGVDLLQNKIIGFEFTKSKAIELASLNAENRFKTNSKGYILLEADMSGVKISGIWDTGAGLTTVDSGYIKKHPDLFEFVKELEANDPTGNGFKMRLYKIKKFKIGHLNFDNMKVLSYDFSAIRAKINDQSINMAIGFNTIINNDWYFNLKDYMWMVK